MSVAISAEQIETYATDGVVCLRRVIPQRWINTLQAGVAKNLASPSDRGRLWNRADDGSTTLYDSQAWRSIDEYRDFVLHSPMAEIAGRVMGCSSVNFFFDAIFVRSAGAQFRTPFHQDEPYWSVAGFDCASSWMPLVPVAKKSALEFVKGSHLWGHRYAQTNFGTLTGDERDQVVFDEQADGLRPFPDIEGDRSQYDLLSWDMEPGDVVIFNARTIHGGSGNLDADRDLRVFNTQWLGDDVRVCFRPEGMDPDHQQVMTEVGLQNGDDLRASPHPERTQPFEALYPRVWSRH